MKSDLTFQPKTYQYITVGRHGTVRTNYKGTGTLYYNRASHKNKLCHEGYFLFLTLCHHVGSKSIRGKILLQVVSSQLSRKHTVSR